MGLKEAFCHLANEVIDCDSCLQKEFIILGNQNVALKIDLEKMEKKSEDHYVNWLTCRDKLDKCRVDLAGGESEQEKFWNNKYPKQNISYKRTEHDREYDMDVRNYFEPYDYHTPTVTGTTNDQKAIQALKWVHDNITYTPDKTEFGMVEYWCRAYQTLEHKKGDCEDGAILMANILLKSKVPYWRIRLNAGDVKGGGHAYLTYCRETDNQFIVLDWCYWYKTISIADRKLHSEENGYYGIWFSWNQKYAFGKMDTMAKTPKNLISNKTGITPPKKATKKKKAKKKRHDTLFY